MFLACPMWLLNSTTVGPVPVRQLRGVPQGLGKAAADGTALRGQQLADDRPGDLTMQTTHQTVSVSPARRSGGTRHSLIGHARCNRSVSILGSHEESVECGTNAILSILQQCLVLSGKQCSIQLYRLCWATSESDTPCNVSIVSLGSLKFVRKTI